MFRSWWGPVVRRFLSFAVDSRLAPSIHVWVEGAAKGFTGVAGFLGSSISVSDWNIPVSSVLPCFQPVLPDGVLGPLAFTCLCQRLLQMYEIQSCGSFSKFSLRFSAPLFCPVVAKSFCRKWTRRSFTASAHGYPELRAELSNTAFKGVYSISCCVVLGGESHFDSRSSGLVILVQNSPTLSLYGAFPSSVRS